MARSNSAARLCALVNAQLAVDVADGRAESSMNVYLSPGAAPTEDGWEVYGRACPRRSLFQLKCHGSRLLPKATATTQTGLTLVPFSSSTASHFVLGATRAKATQATQGIHQRIS